MHWNYFFVPICINPDFATKWVNVVVISFALRIDRTLELRDVSPSPNLFFNEWINPNVVVNGEVIYKIDQVDPLLLKKVISLV